MTAEKKRRPVSVDDAQKQIARELRELDEPFRTALEHIHSALDTAQALSVSAFGDAATPEHTLALLEHLLAETERIELESEFFDESE